MDLSKNVSQATAGTATLNVDKPQAGKLIIRAISLWSKEDLEFFRIYGYVFERQHINQRKGLFNKIIPQNTNGIPVRIWEGAEDWPDNWRLSVFLKTQTAVEVLHYVVSYEVVIPKKKSWWSGV